MITSKQLQEIKKIEGEMKGVMFKNDFDFVKKEVGRGQMEKMKKRLKELGCKEEDILKDRIKTFTWYPIWCHVLFFLILYQEMGWTKDDIFKIGYHGSQVSLILKVFPKSLFNLKKFFLQADKYWKKHFTIGDVEILEIDLKKKYIILNLKNFNAHPLELCTIKGYLTGMINLTHNLSNVKIQETKNVHQGDEFHQLKITWD